jgi:tetratricopeptide (TPR) repeat protein
VDSPPVAPQTAVEIERVTGLEATLARADLALHSSRPELAHKLFEQIAREHPDTPAAEAGLGTLAMAEGRREEARRHLERAVALNSRDAGTWFEYAMLERETGAGRARVDELLEKAASLNPNFAEAHFMLGVRATDDGRYPAAIIYLRQAVRALPRQSYFWHALAYAQQKLGQREEAIESAARAVLTAATAEQEHMASALLEGLREDAQRP